MKTLLGIILAGLLLAGCAVNPVTGRKELALMQVSDAQEIALGQKAYPQIIQQMGGAYPDPRLQAYVSEVGLRVARRSHRPDLPYRFTVINDGTPNAFALPGGFIAVTRGLLVNLENEAQLAAVLGHEVAHVTARHSVQGMQRGALLNLGVAVLSGVTQNEPYGALSRQAGGLAATLVDNKYSREQESESDRLGIDYMVQAGYDPAGAAQVQEIFYRKIEGGAEPDWLSGLFRSHPFSRERMLENERYIAARYAEQMARSELGARGAPFLRATDDLRRARAGYELYEQARRLEAQGELQAALSTYQQAVSAAPDEALIYTGLGLASLKAQDPISGRRYLQKAIALDPDYYESHLGLGYILLEKGEDRAAVAELERSMELLPTLSGAFLLAEGYEKTGQRDRALTLYRNVAEADPDGKLGRAAAARIRALGGR